MVIRLGYRASNTTINSLYEWYNDIKYRRCKYYFGVPLALAWKPTVSKTINNFSRVNINTNQDCLHKLIVVLT